MSTSGPAEKSSLTRLFVMVGIALGTALFVGANAHLVYVSFASQPACVDHPKAGEAGPGQHVAAKSSC